MASTERTSQRRPRVPSPGRHGRFPPPSHPPCCRRAVDHHGVPSRRGHVLTVIRQVYHCLEELKKFRAKYSIHEDLGNVDASDPSSSLVLDPGANSELPSTIPLFRNTRVATEVVRDMALRQRRAKTVSFFRKVTFTWSLNDDTNDRDKIMSHVQTLKTCNDALRECVPQQQRYAADRLTNVKALSLSESSSELQGIGGAVSSARDQLHHQIYQAIMVKARRVDDSSHELTTDKVQQVLLNQATLTFNTADSPLPSTTGISTRILAQQKTSSTTIQPAILEWVSFPPSLSESDLDLLKNRIALLCTLLRSAGHPYFPALPLCYGFFEQSPTSFTLVYQLPPFAIPTQPPRSLFSLLPRNKYSVVAEKPTTPSLTNNVLPTLEERYKLASALADAVLSLLSVTWMHKTITSRNIVLYHAGDVSPGNPHRVDFGSPQLLGFGLARRERQGEGTVDLRDGGVSPWRFWQHPELRSAGEQHRRFEQRFDIFSLGVVLFEIGMWQDAHYYSSSASESGPGSSAGEFRRRLLHVCAREMAHRMGEAYKAAVMACLDGDEIWAGT